MNPFINNQKRSVELPSGCKDLIDALAKRNQELDSKARWKLLNGLQEAEQYLAGLLLRPEAVLYISIDLDPPHSPHRLQVTPVRDQLCILLVVDGSEKGRLSRIRRLFGELQISPMVDALGSISVLTETSTRILIYPLPPAAQDSADMVLHVIREGFEIAEEAPLYLTSNEKTIA